jgi:hypothetical protein
VQIGFPKQRAAAGDGLKSADLKPDNFTKLVLKELGKESGADRR